MTDAAAIDWTWLANGAIDDFKTHRIQCGATTASAASYATGVRAFVRYCRGTGVEPSEGVGSFPDHLARQDELSPSTRSNYQSHALSFVQFLRGPRSPQPNLDADSATEEPGRAPDAPWPNSLDRLPTTELLAGYARTLIVLRARGVLRTANAPLGDYAEWLVWQAFGGTLEPNSTKSHDVTDGRGQRLQVKARLVSPKPTSGQRQTSQFRSWAFDYAILIQFDEADYSVVRASKVPVDLFDEGRANAKWSEHVRGWAVFMTPELMGHPEAVDVTAELRAASAAS